MTAVLRLGEAAGRGAGGRVVHALHEAGLRGCLLPASALLEALERAGLADAVARANSTMAASPERTGKVLAELRGSILGLPVPPNLTSDVVPKSGLVALAVSEEGSWCSLPGAIEERLDGAIARAWAEIASEEAAFYFRRSLPGAVAVALVRGSVLQVAEAVARTREGGVRPARATIIGLESIEQLETLDLATCWPLFVRQLLKKAWVRRFCDESGINTFRTIYAFCRARDLTEVEAMLLERMRLPFLRIDSGGRSALVRREDLADALAMAIEDGRPPKALAAGALEPGPSSDTFTCLQVAEVLPAEAQGLSTVLADGSVLIEALPAGLRGAKDGRHAPSTVLLHASGGRITARPAVFASRAVLDTAAGGWREREVQPFVFGLAPASADSIAAMTRTLTARYGQVRVEWYVYRGRAWFKDISFESRALQAGSRVLSPGAACGPALHVRDCASLDAAARDLGLSVIDHAPPDQHAAIEQLRARVRAAGRPIIVAPYPSTGLTPLIPDVAGFVFSRAPLLCHAAIILREAGCPAVVLRDAFDSLPEGTWAALSSSGVEINAGGSS